MIELVGAMLVFFPYTIIQDYVCFKSHLFNCEDFLKKVDLVSEKIPNSWQKLLKL